MSTQLDYYGILQVHPRAEREVIDAAYRKLAGKYHPDLNRSPDAAEKMKQINIAYEVLSNPVRRAAYDAARGAAPSPGTPPHAATRSQHRTRAWRMLLIAVGLMLLAVVAFRSGTSFLLLAPKLVVPLVVISLVAWFVFTLAKPRG